MKKQEYKVKKIFSAQMSRIWNKNESHKNVNSIKIKGMTLGYPGFIQTTMSRRRQKK